MSYFFGTLGNARGVQSGFRSFLGKIASAHVITPSLSVQSGPAGLVAFNGKKAIQDILIEDDTSGSWLALLGTPLWNDRSAATPGSVLPDFFAHPGRWLRTEVDGNFLLVAYDARTRRLVTATDTNSTVPVFYSRAFGALLLSSHELALARIIGAKIDPFGFSQAIHLGATWGHHTRFCNIQKLLPCQVCTFDESGGILAETYWRPYDESVLHGDLDAHLDRWMPLLRDSVRQYHECAGRRPVIADFTAGEDGRLLVAQCRALGIPFKAHVTGLETDTDVIVAKRAANTAGFELIVRQKHHLNNEQLLPSATAICLQSDGYQDFFKSCSEFATDLAVPLDDYRTVKYCGLPGGEAFRGSYYLRGKAFFPALNRPLDCEFFTRMKYLLDFRPGLMRFADAEFIAQVRALARESLEDVKDFPVGTQIDHLLRMFQTSLLGLKYKNPLYLPFATNAMTRSIYWLSPRYKQGGRLTRASTELLFPEIALVRTQSGVPTIRRTLLTSHLFAPEYISLLKKVSSGTFSRLLKWTKPNKWYSSDEWTTNIFTTLLHGEPFCSWFSSPNSMATGSLYASDVLTEILDQAKVGVSNCVPILGRIISMELAYRWVSAGRQPPHAAT